MSRRARGPITESSNNQTLHSQQSRNKKSVHMDICSSAAAWVNRDFPCSPSRSEQTMQAAHCLPHTRERSGEFFIQIRVCSVLVWMSWFCFKLAIWQDMWVGDFKKICRTCGFMMCRDMLISHCPHHARYCDDSKTTAAYLSDYVHLLT